MTRSRPSLPAASSVLHASRTLAIVIAMSWLTPPQVARCAVPSAANSTAPTMIRLVGATAAFADTADGQFLVVVRDLVNNPKNGSNVVVDFSGCPDIQVCADQLDPNAVVFCSAKTVRKFTDANGSVQFTILGSSTGPAVSIGGCAKIFASGALLRTPSVAAFDLDGAGGVGAGDLSIWLADFGSGMAWARSDYDGSGTVGAGDLSLWLEVFGSGRSPQSCSTSCP